MSAESRYTRTSLKGTGVNEIPVTDWAAAERQQSARGPDFDAFYVAELPRLVRLARRLCGASLAEDVAQEAMLVAYRRWSHVVELDRPDLWVGPAPT